MTRTAIIEWLTSFVPHPAAPPWRERARRCAGAMLGIAFTGLATHLLFGAAGDIPLLVAPMGASAVLLFGASDSPLAQPWSILGGNFVSALVGVACAQWIASPVAAASVAVALAICAMFLCRCVHPPSGAVALTAVLGGPAVHALGFHFVLAPIAIQSVALLSAALAFHALTGHRYPRAAFRPTPEAAAAPLAAIAHPLLEPLLEPLDVPRKSFEQLTCEEIMSAQCPAVPATMGAHAAREMFRRHGASTLPVVDAMDRVVGMVTHHALGDLAPAAGFRRVWGALRRALLRESARVEETVEAVMAAGVHAVHRATPLAHLVPIFTDHAYHDIPVMDDARRLVGVVRHSDMIRWLHHHAGAAQPAAAAG
ncbi:CBS domain-containing membrane protein [Paraburkholderia unamae]|uniref:HPP family protein n=1 Tax=Paraburkholderia unamae TaxID=219649 RepID=UPI000DC2C7DE|nr:HPP family protein [Paraburkholderia unamae]RAR51362.1 CBS domain-containing membrane protein [Paraburkholderia unamae]